MGYRDDFDQAIKYLEDTRAAAKAWADGDCGQGKGGCSQNSTEKDKQRCCINTEKAPYPPRAIAAIKLLHGIKDEISKDAKAIGPFLGGYNALVSFFGGPDNNWDDSRYQSAEWSSILSILDSALTDLKAARGVTGPFQYILLGAVILAVVGALVFYYKG